MTTLITATDKHGRLRRCDARCYNAKGTTCTCICGGLNHAMGFKKAIHLTLHLMQLLLRRIKHDHPKTIQVDFSNASIRRRFHTPRPSRRKFPHEAA